VFTFRLWAGALVVRLVLINIQKLQHCYNVIGKGTMRNTKMKGTLCLNWKTHQREIYNHLVMGLFLCNDIFKIIKTMIFNIANSVRRNNKSKNANSYGYRGSTSNGMYR